MNFPRTKIAGVDRMVLIVTTGVDFDRVGQYILIMVVQAQI